MKHGILCKYANVKQLTLLCALCLLFTNLTYAQQSPAQDVKSKMLQIYNNIKNKEVPFEKFYESNKQFYTNQFNKSSNTTLQAAAATGPYCNKVSKYCTNGDFESGLDQTQYTGAYGVYSQGDLYPNPFDASTYTYGFSSGPLADGNSHQTIVNTSSGTDPVTHIALTPPNGGKQSLRLGNSYYLYGTEILAKTVVVDPNETILNFYYAVVLEDPGHPHNLQPAFSVRAYDCATGQELPNVCNLGNGDNIVVSDAKNPFFKSTTYNFGLIAYRDWSQAQINLSKYVGKTVIIVFTNKDCGAGGHFGYTYLDNLFSSQCPVGTVTTDQGSITFDKTKSTDCGTGQICVNYTLPKSKSTSNPPVIKTGEIKITLDIYQNNALVKTMSSPLLSAGTSYCFATNPSTLGLNASLGGFDYVLTGNFTLSGFTLTPIIVGNPPTGQKSGINNDYLITCPPPTNPNVYYSKPSGDLHNVLSWGINPDGSGATPPDFTAGKTFVLSNRAGNYTMTGNWTVGGLIVNNPGNQLKLNGFTLSEAGISGAGTLSGTMASNLIVTGASGAGILNFTQGYGLLKNLTINSSASATLGTPLDVYNMLTIQNGTLNTGNLLTLKSTATTTAVVAPVVGTVLGNAMVERYIPARRAWRMINAPVTGTQTVRAWQEGGANATDNPHPGYGTHITGGPIYGTSANGFDLHPGSESSLKYYDMAANNWLPVHNTNVIQVGNIPYMLFIRGDRHLVLDGPNLAPNNTTLRSYGSLLTGNQTYPVSATGFTAIANPYQSPINFGTITKTNVQNLFYVWDPKLGGLNGRGAYVTVSWNGSSYDVTPAPVSPESQYIQPWQSFMVRSTGSAGSIVIKESDKGGPINNVYRTTDGNTTGVSGTASNNIAIRDNDGISSFRVSLQAAGENAATVLDEVLTTYKAEYSNKVDELDAEKMTNTEENLALVRSGKNLAIERREEISASDTMFLQLSNTSQRSYVLQFTATNFSPAKYAAFLEDKYLHTSTLIDMSKATQVTFTVTADAASGRSDRFRVVFVSGKASPIVASNSGKSAVMSYPNPISGNTVNVHLINVPKGAYQVQIVNSIGQMIYQKGIEHAGGSVIYTLQLPGKPAKGLYQLQVNSNTFKANLKLSIN